jgi:LL-diaminopimelate aminotransferase
MIIQTAQRIADLQEYYFSRKLQEIDQMRKGGANIINLGIGSPDMMPSEKTIDRLISETRNPHNHGYQSYLGIPELREAFAKWYLKYFQVNLDPSGEILPLIGSKEGIVHISLAFVNPGDEVLIPNPGYPTYESATRLAAGKIRYYDLTAEDNWYPNLVKLEKEGLENVKLMWVNYPHMPTGTKATEALFRNLIAFGHRNNILICNDNPYSFILNNQHLSLLSIPEAKDIALELNSLSKSHNMAGWRIGMLGGHRDYIKAVLRVKSNMDSGMFRPLQLAAAEALENPASWHQIINNTYMQRRLTAFEIMDALQCTYDKSQVGLFVWGKIPPSQTSAEEISDLVLHKAHVFITPGFIFGSNGKEYLRISLCTSKKLLQEAKNRILVRI